MTRRSRKGSNDHTRSIETLDALKRRELELDPIRNAWDHQPNETPRNYGLFQMYRDMGRVRSVPQIAELSPLTFSSIARISRLNKWAERAGRWDAEQDRITAIRLADAREEMCTRQAKAARLLMDKALKRLADLDVNAISPHALVLMMDTSARIERAALGLETMKGGATQTSVTVAATTGTDGAGKQETRVEVGVQHDKIMATLDAMVQRMSPEQLSAGYEELSAGAEEAARDLNAALPAPPPQ